MDKRLVAFIQRAVQSPEELFPLNTSWQALHREYNIGQPQGSRIRVTAADKAELAELALRVSGVDVRAAPLANFAGMNRQDALHLAKQEKWAGQAVAAGRVLLKALPGQDLRVNGASLRMPPRSHLDIALDALADLGHGAFIVVENYACFDWLDTMRLVLDGAAAQAAVVYRGDSGGSRADTVLECLRRLAVPVWAMADIDPAGLVIAQSLPHAVGALAPSLADIDRLLTQRGNPDLYRKQRPGAEQTLRASPHAFVRQCWALIEARQAGLAQELWLHGTIEIVAHRLDAAIISPPASR